MRPLSTALIACAVLVSACEDRRVGQPALPGMLDVAIPLGATIEHYGTPEDEDMVPSTLTQSGVLIEHHWITWFTADTPTAHTFLYRLQGELEAEGWEITFSPDMDDNQTQDFWGREIPGQPQHLEDVAVGTIQAGEGEYLIMLSHGLRTLPDEDTTDE